MSIDLRIVTEIIPGTRFTLNAAGKTWLDGMMGEGYAEGEDGGGLTLTFEGLDMEPNHHGEGCVLCIDQFGEEWAVEIADFRPNFNFCSKVSS